MKTKLNGDEIEDIREAIASCDNTVLEPYLEKDIILTSMIHDFSSIKLEGAELCFCGGTCLSKAYHIIERMSEDVDFKLVVPEDYENFTTSAKRKYASKVMHSLFDEFKGVGVTFNEKFRPKNNNQFFLFFNDYDSTFKDTYNVLRAKGVKVEFTVMPNRKMIKLPFTTIVDELLGRPPIASILCQSIEEIFCEKTVG